uniref:Sulfotransfer_1 domain-containing protein n=1 Tax=Rhabditophanes sp. KR3021 TaxID=114890 RepID=A0AC35U274_9BILA
MTEVYNKSEELNIDSDDDLVSGYSSSVDSSNGSLSQKNIISYIKEEEDKVVYQYLAQPRQSKIDGELWPPIFEPANVRSAKNLRLREWGDSVIVTYPKCGTTWLLHIASQLVRSDYGPAAGKELSLTSPMIERMGAPFVDQIASPRVLKSHFNYQNCPQNSGAKYVFCVRNPKDALVSYFFHNINFKIYNFLEGEFNEFFELFITGQLAFGCYFEHLASWLPHIHDKNVLFIKYEDMLADLEGSIVKVGQFYGDVCQKDISNPHHLAEVTSNSTLEAMKENQERWFPKGVLHEETFIRKGNARDWKNYFSKSQSDRLDAKFQKMFGNSEAAGWWKNEMAWDNNKNEEDSAFEDVSPCDSRRNSTTIAKRFVPIIKNDSIYFGSSFDSGVGSFSVQNGSPSVSKFFNPFLNDAIRNRSDSTLSSHSFGYGSLHKSRQ